MRIKPKTNIASLEISHMINCNLEAYMLLITLCFFYRQNILRTAVVSTLRVVRL